MKLDFVTKGAVLVLFSVFCFAMACVGAALIIRAARNEFIEARTDNLKDLIEGTQEDIRRNQDTTGS